MMTKPVISVIVPVYGTQSYIDLCIESLLNQTIKDIEVILVDDGSPDLSPEICDRYAKTDKRIKVIHKLNEGAGIARNVGLDIASGTFVCFLDSDDCLALNALEFCYKVAEKEKADQVRYLFSRFASSDYHPTTIRTSGSYVVAVGYNKIQPIVNAISPLFDGADLVAPTTASGSTALYRRSIIENNNIRFRSERSMTGEDLIFCLETAICSDKIVYTDNRFYNYRHTPHSLSTKVDHKRIEKASKFSETYANILRNYGYKDSGVMAMTYIIGELRSYNKHLFYSNLPVSEKKKYFLDILNAPVVKLIKETYPVENLAFMQRVAFELHLHGCFWQSYFITRLRDLFKR